MSSFGYLPDGFHSYSGEPEKEVRGVYDSKEKANEAAKNVFYKCNEWGWKKSDFERHRVKETNRKGMLEMSVVPPDI